MPMVIILMKPATIKLPIQSAPPSKSVGHISIMCPSIIAAWASHHTGHSITYSIISWTQSNTLYVWDANATTACQTWDP